MQISRKVKFGCLAPIAAIVLLVVVVCLIDWLVPSTARRALPRSAREVQEYYSDSWNGDFVRLVKAKLPEEDYAKYAAALNLSVCFDPFKHADVRSMIDLGVGDAPGWWDAPEASVTTFFDHTKGDDHVQCLKYSHGTVYFMITSW